MRKAPPAGGTGRPSHVPPRGRGYHLMRCPACGEAWLTVAVEADCTATGFAVKLAEVEEDEMTDNDTMMKGDAR